MECIGQVLGGMATDMIMIVMEAGMMIRMVMEETGNMAIEMVIGMADMGTQTVVMKIVMAEIMKIATAEMVTGMMTIEVEVLMVINMAQEVGALIETVLLMMMVLHLGMHLLLLRPLYCYVLFKKHINIVDSIILTLSRFMLKQLFSFVWIL